MSGGNLLAYDQSLSNPITGSAAVLAVTFQVKSGVAAGTRVSAITDIVATDGNSDQSLNDASGRPAWPRPSGNANLAGLSCGTRPVSGLSPPEPRNTASPCPMTCPGCPWITVPADGGADVSVSGNQLSVGVNTVVLTVTAANGPPGDTPSPSPGSRTPNVTLSSDASLSDLTPLHGAAVPGLFPEITEYAVYVPMRPPSSPFPPPPRDSKALGVTQPGRRPEGRATMC